MWLRDPRPVVGKPAPGGQSDGGRQTLLASAYTNARPLNVSESAHAPRSAEVEASTSPLEDPGTSLGARGLGEVGWDQVVQEEPREPGCRVISALRFG